MTRKTVLILVISLVFATILASSAAMAAAPAGSSIISNSLTHTLAAGQEQIKLSWIPGREPPASANIGTRFTVGVEARNTGGDIERVLYIVEIKKDGKPATPADVQISGSTESEGETYPLGYDSAHGFFYWGQPSGFTFPGNTPREATFEVTVKNAGTYSVEIYAVQLP